MRKRIISIDSAAATRVLKKLQVNGISCIYLGIDQADKILMEITYNEEQERIIQQVTEYMKEIEKCLQEINSAFQNLLKKKQDELDQEIKRFRLKYPLKKRNHKESIIKSILKKTI